MKVGKQEIINKYVELKGVTKKDAEKNFEESIDVIKELIKEGHDVSIMNFGTFERRETKARECKNPRTEEIIQVPAGEKVAFKGSKKLKELL